MKKMLCRLVAVIWVGSAVAALGCLQEEGRELDEEDVAAEGIGAAEAALAVSGTPSACIVDCAYESAICADEALVRKAKCNGDTCLRDAHRAHAAALLACKKAHPNDPAGLMKCSSAADQVLIAAMQACPSVPNQTKCEDEYKKDQKACNEAFDACVAGCPATP